MAVTGILAGVLAVQHNAGAAIAVLIVAGLLFLASFHAIWVLTGLVIRARAELALFTVGGLLDWWLHTMLTGFWAEAILAGSLAVTLVVPASRRFVVNRFWCVLDRHRLRACLRQTKVRTMNMDGALPLMLWARPTKTGERVWLWIRAGSASDDLEAALPYIAPACYAREARLHEVRKLTTLVAVDIIRRDPLAKPQPITSVLARYAAKVAGNAPVEGTEPIQATSVTDITNRVVDDAPTTSTGSASGNGKAKKTMPLAPAIKPGPSTSSGDDLTDYIDID